MPHKIARRSLLAGISAAPTILVAATLPTAVLAHPAAPRVHADVALIAQAARVIRLSRLHDRATARISRKADAVMLARGPRPAAPDAWGGTCLVEDVPVGPGIERVFVTTLFSPPADHQEAKRRHAKALAAWLAKSDRLAWEIGAPEASSLCDTLFDRLQDAVDALVGMPATDSAAVAAKAGAFLALMKTRQEAEEWVAGLARSLARDAAQIGRGAA